MQQYFGLPFYDSACYPVLQPLPKFGFLGHVYSLSQVSNPDDIYILICLSASLSWNVIFQKPKAFLSLLKYLTLAGVFSISFAS